LWLGSGLGFYGGYISHYLYLTFICTGAMVGVKLLEAENIKHQ
jgi:hypothetical protein